MNLRLLVLLPAGLLGACVSGANSDRELAESLAGGLATLCPVSAPDDEKARNECAAALTDYGLLRDSMAQPFMWGGQPEQDGGVEDGFNLDSHVTRFDPRVFRRLYLSLYGFPKEHTIETRADGTTLLHLKPKFRNKLDMGAYPYPFWHRLSKWENYQLAQEVVLTIKNKQILGGQRSFAAYEDRTGYVTHEWGGQWEWRKGGELMPFATLYTYLFSKENPYVVELDAAYRSAEAKLRQNNCLVCHSPDNGSSMNQLELFSYPNQALSGRHRIVQQLEKNLMPTQDPARGYNQGMQDEKARAELLELAKKFAALGDQAMQWEGELR
jgi:hypothetical protein